jgi:hypothetical protein
MTGSAFLPFSDASLAGIWLDAGQHPYLSPALTTSRELTVSSGQALPIRLKFKPARRIFDESGQRVPGGK